MSAFRRRSVRGATLVELLTASTLSLLVFAGTVAVLFAGSSSWARGVGKLGAESDSEMATRVVSQQLRQAMAVSVDANGFGLTYRLPRLGANGSYLVPIAWDGVVRRMSLMGDKLTLIDNGVRRVVARGLILTDPSSKGGAAKYRLFTPGPGAVTHEVTIEVSTSRSAARADKVSSRSRETIFLRNIPQTTQ
jgi:hypothetical protein